MRITNNEETIRITNWIDFTKQNMTKNVKKIKIGSNQSGQLKAPSADNSARTCSTYLSCETASFR